MPKLISDAVASDLKNDGIAVPLFTRIIERIITFIAVSAHVGWLLLIVVILTNVVLRYVFSNSSVAMEEVQWHLYAYSFMVGVSYCLVQDQHVRVDVLAEHWPSRRRAWIDLLAMVLLVMPFAYIIANGSIPFVEFSHKLSETSRSPGGLPYRWILKSVIPFAFGLLFLAAITRALRMIAVIRAK
ncbi:TRAP transporter small permease subunit [Ahrensia kielensis]|uniref:TRAP transporter small permease subunit n=1 Tax=Ahrensia kielensis TaxID=76980 RepID=UPI00036205EC|nr:TRAP transporter small permease subunit [Ahrensia kielensis]